MRKITTILLIMLLVTANAISMTAIATEENSVQTSFYYNLTFNRVIDDNNYYMEVCIDAYCYGGHTGEGVALASVEYDHVMLHNDSDTGAFVTVWAHAGDYQSMPCLFPDASKRRAVWSIVDRGVDLLS